MPTLSEMSKPSLAGFGKYVNTTGVQDWQSPEATDFLKRIQAYDPNASWLDRGGGDGGQSLGAILNFDITKMPKAQGSDPLQGNMPVLNSGAMEVSQPGFRNENIAHQELVHRNDPTYGDWTAGNNVPQKEGWQDRLGKMAFMAGMGTLGGMAGGALLPGLGSLGPGLGKFGINELLSGGKANPMGLLGSLAGMIPGVGSAMNAIPGMDYLKYIGPALSLARLARGGGSA